MGIIAQDLEKIYPFLIETRENGFKAIRYDRLIGLIIEGIKELEKVSHEPQNYRDECETLKRQVSELAQQVKELKDASSK
tara:strand:- start:179 stop:418 length:240 start_codon:yes stop_codon:yes gene_type:complete